MSDIPRFLKFQSNAYTDGSLLVHSFKGHEAISRLFRFEIELASEKSDYDFTKILKEPAWLGIRQIVSADGSYQTLKIHGVLSSFEMVGASGRWVHYRAVLVPKIWRMSLTTQSQLYLEPDAKVKTILEKELKEIAPGEFDVSGISGSHPDWEQKVQYLETNLNFLMRVAEHEGVHFHFKHDDSMAKAIFGDSNNAFKPIVGVATLPFRPSGETGDAARHADWASEVVRTLACRQSVVAQKVLLRDYNYRNPSSDLKVEETCDPDGVGTAYFYGEHYKTTGEGKTYAQTRIQEILCRKTVYYGESSAKAFHAGATFTLSDHFKSNGDYLLTEVWHEAFQPLDHEGAEGSQPWYRNRFVCIPKDTPFRPERITHKPRAWTLNATVDGGGSGQYAEIDDMGRYKVKVPFDLGAKSDGKASRFVRMLQPHAGPKEGMHFPLRKGTEVVLDHMNGDPDRPLIVGAVPNPETGSPVTGGNHTQFVLQAFSGNNITFENSSGTERICIHSPHCDSYV